MSDKTDKQRIPMIKVRGEFSDRKGIIKFDVDFQTEEFDDRTRRLLNNQLYDLLEMIFNKKLVKYKYKEKILLNGANEFCKNLLSEVFLQRTNSEYKQYDIWKTIYEKKINNVIENAPYNEVLDILEYIANWIDENMIYQFDIYSAFNDFFEKEFIGYRFVENKIVAITNKNEINSIESACNSKYEGVNSHMQKAVGFLSNKENKDYKNSIKESISAVESICQIVAEDEKATLGQALKVIKEKGIILHPALEKGFSSLYGYTSDQGGIRHCEGMFESTVTFEEAKFMLISCSAFINFLIAENEKRI